VRGHKFRCGQWCQARERATTAAAAELRELSQ
jgi:hypothetical protein